MDEIPDEKKDTDWEDSITNRMMHWNYSEEQKAELRKAMDARIPKSVIFRSIRKREVVIAATCRRKSDLTLLTGIIPFS